MNQGPLPEAGLVEIVDEIFLPLLRGQATRRRLPVAALELSGTAPGDAILAAVASEREERLGRGDGALHVVRL